MKIKRLSIRNFRAIREFEYNCAESINVFIGVNGAGKSTLLDALDILFSWLAALIRNPKGAGQYLRDEDITYNGDRREGFVSLELTIEDRGQEVSWKLYKQNSKFRTSIQGRSEYAELREWVNRLVNSEEVSIPLYKKYHIHRRVASETPKKIRKRTFDKYSIYDDASEGQLNFRAFFTWFKELEEVENAMLRETGNLVEHRGLLAVRRAMGLALPQYTGLKMKRLPTRFVLSKEGQMIEFDALSDGEKAYLTLVADIARCLSIVNPDSRDCLSSEAVIVIDEIDLHLHPKWQGEILSQLREIFPNCQFFISTHSPFVVSSLVREKDALFTLRDGVGTEATPDYHGSAVGDILLGGFGMQSLRAKHSQDLIDEAWAYLKRDQKVDFSKVLSRLKNILSPSDPEFVHMALQEKLNEKLRLDNEKD